MLAKFAPKDVSSSVVDNALPRATSLTPADPLMPSTYLSSPLDTILESLHDPAYVSPHDLVEAYNVISMRIRSQSQVIMHTKHRLPAFTLLGEHASLLAQALSRDVRRALSHPSSGFRTPAPFASSSTNPPMTNNDIQYARDLSILCHHALRLLSDVFSFEPLHSLFPGMRHHCTNAPTL